MAHERAMALFIGIIMIGSVAGYAIANFSFINTSGQQQGPQIPNIVDRILTTEEKIYVLQTGRVLIEDLHALNCSTECSDISSELESFSGRFQNFTVLERVSVEYNETKLQMIGSSGRIVELQNESITESNLLKIFCGISIVQPRECLLMDI